MRDFFSLMRLNKPVGIFLLLWPTLWALWLASHGQPDVKIVIIFIIGVVLMRSAGCVINDIADRHVDGLVARTRLRPLATGRVSVQAALFLFAVLCVAAFLLVLLLNTLALYLAFLGLLLTIIYPFMKRFTHLPQLGLGAAFAWGVPMAFAAEINGLPANAWLLFLAAALWPIIYDTMYAMADQADDIKIGVKSTAILFGRKTTLILGCLQLLLLILLTTIGVLFKLRHFYFLSLIGVALLFGYQLHLISQSNPKKCFHAFLNNNWVGFIIFFGIIAGLSS